MSEIDKNELRCIAWDKALEACATQALFEKRAARIKLLNNIKDFLGIFVPAAIGVTAMSIEIAPNIFKVLVAITVVPIISQLAISIWSLVQKWNDDYVSCITSIKANNSIKREWEDFGNGITDVNKQNFDRIMKRNTDQEHLDLEKDISEKEKRYGMRYGLRQYKRACVECNVVPTSLKPSRCNICGQF